MRLALLAGSALLAGCVALPQPVSEGGDCQIRAGAAVGEGLPAWGVEASGGAVTVIGNCPKELHVLSRTPQGSVVCFASDEWCKQAIGKPPVVMTIDQLKALTE